MKFFVVLALYVAAASAFTIPPIIAGSNAAEIQQIIDAIYHPSTDPATAAALEQMLLEILGNAKPEPGNNEEISPIQTLPEIIDASIVSEPANYQPSKPPLVQIIINVNGKPAGTPVVVDQPGTSPAIFPEDVMVVEQPAIVPEEVVVVEKPEITEPVIIAPIQPAPVITIPDTLN